MSSCDRMLCVAGTCHRTFGAEYVDFWIRASIVLVLRVFFYQSVTLKAVTGDAFPFITVLRSQGV